jgi:hypothetical protein
MNNPFKQILINFRNAAIMFGIVLAGMMIWGVYHPEIQDAIRTAQNILFGGF